MRVLVVFALLLLSQLAWAVAVDNSLVVQVDFCDEVKTLRSDWSLQSIQSPQINKLVSLPYDLSEIQGEFQFQKVIRPQGDCTPGLYFPAHVFPFQVWVNSQLVDYAMDSASQIPSFRPLLVNLNPDSIYDIRIKGKVAKGFSGAAMRPVQVGEVGELSKKHDYRLLIEILLFSGALVAGFYQLVFYFYNRRRINSLMFALFALIVSVRALFTDEMGIYMFFPSLDWLAVMHLEYLSYFLAVPAFSAYARLSFPEEFKTRWWTAYIFGGIIFSIISLFTPAKNLLDLRYIVHVFTVIGGSTIIWKIIQAIRNKRGGAVIFLMAWVVLFITILIDISANILVLDFVAMVPLGTLLFVFTQGQFLNLRFIREMQNVRRISREIERTNTANQRFISEDLLHLCGVEKIQDLDLGYQRSVDSCIIFVDLQGYTSVSETLNPAQNMNLLNEYFAKVMPVFRKYNGFVERFIGDAMLVVFRGLPEQAVVAAQEMLELLDEYYHLWRLRAGIGLHYASISFGVVGVESRMQIISEAKVLSRVEKAERLTRQCGSKVVLTKEMITALPPKQQRLYTPLDSENEFYIHNPLESVEGA